MSFRPPSLGFLYLVAAVACFIGFFAYIMRPMWWELESEEQRNLAEAAYLERIVEGAPKGKQAPWLTDSLRMYVAGQDLAAAARVLAKADQLGITLAPDVLVEVLPKTCWIVGAQEDRVLRAKQSAAVYLRNDSDQEQVVRMCWTSMRNGRGAVRAVDEEWQLFDLKRGKEAIVERVVPPKSAVLLEARVASQVSKDPSAKLGMRLVRAEVQS
jgi:hypothetical protein